MGMKSMLKRTLVLGAVCCMMLFGETADAGKIKSKLKGRHRTGLPGQGYEDTLNVPGQPWGSS